MSCMKSVLGLFAWLGSLIAADPAVGSRTLNVAKSKFSSGPRPRVPSSSLRKVATE
jgi:hypothetical protein